MPAAPLIQRTVAVFDGQNLFHSVKSAFGYTYTKDLFNAKTETIFKHVYEAYSGDGQSAYTGTG